MGCYGWDDTKKSFESLIFIAVPWSEEVFVIKKVKNTVPWTFVINDFNEKEIVGTFYKKELKRTNQKEFRIEKVIMRKDSKLYVKWKGYNNSFNSCIDHNINE